MFLIPGFSSMNRRREFAKTLHDNFESLSYFLVMIVTTSFYGLLGVKLDSTISMFNVGLGGI